MRQRQNFSTGVQRAFLKLFYKTCHSSRLGARETTLPVSKCYPPAWGAPCQAALQGSAASSSVLRLQRLNWWDETSSSNSKANSFTIAFRHSFVKVSIPNKGLSFSAFYWAFLHVQSILLTPAPRSLQPFTFLSQEGQTSAFSVEVKWIHQSHRKSGNTFCLAPWFLLLLLNCLSDVASEAKLAA